MRNTSENKVLKYNSSFVGTVIFMFGFLKFFEPFHTWFHIQIAKSGLPPLSAPLGIAGEISIGLSTARGYFLQTEDRESVYADHGFGLSRTHRKHGSGELCPFASRGAGGCSSLGNKTSVHPAGLRAFGWAESLSTLSNQ